MSLETRCLRQRAAHRADTQEVEILAIDIDGLNGVTRGKVVRQRQQSLVICNASMVRWAQTAAKSFNTRHTVMGMERTGTAAGKSAEKPSVLL